MREIDENPTFRKHLGPIKSPCLLISGYKKLEVVVDVSGDKADDDDKKSDETTVDDKPKEDTKSSAGGQA
jgi:hypothetical protein